MLLHVEQVQYCLLDSGSTTALCSTSLVKNVGLNPIKGHVQLNYPRCLDECSHEVGALHVPGLNEVNTYEIPSCRILNELLDVSENIPNNDIVTL